MVAGKRPGDGAAPVVSDEVEALAPEGGRHGEHVAAELADPVRVDALWARALRVPALAGSNGSIPGLGETIQGFVPAGPGLREAVEQEHEVTVLRSRGERVEPHASRRNGCVLRRHAPSVAGGPKSRAAGALASCTMRAWLTPCSRLTSAATCRATMRADRGIA